MSIESESKQKGQEYKKTHTYISPTKAQAEESLRRQLAGKKAKQKAIEKGVSSDSDTAKKLARIAAIKAAALANKKYNVATSTAADPGASPAMSSLLGYGGGGGGGYYEGTSESKRFSFSDIPSIVWIVLAVGAGYWLIKSGGKGKKLF